MAVPTALSYLGVAKEAVKGTGLAPTSFIPVKTLNPFDKVEYFPVEVLQGAMTDLYGEVQGYKWTEFEIGGPVFPDTWAWPAAGVMGDLVAATGSRTVADGVTTNLSPNITSATAAFTQNDVGRSLTTANFPAGSYIAIVTSGTAAVMNVNATASGGSQSFVIGNASVFQNTMALQNGSSGQPTSHTLTDFYAVTQARQYAGIQWQEMALKFSTDGLLEYTAKATGLVASAPVSKPTQSFTAVTALPTWAGTLAIGGVGVIKGVDGDLTITRKVAVIKALTGSQQPAQIFIGQILAKGKIVFYIDDDTELTRYLTNTQPSLSLLFTTGGTPASLASIQFQASKAAYTSVKPVRSKEYVQYEAEFTAVANTTDVGASAGYGPCVLRAQSLVNGGYV